jgi:hypothetical protein
MLRRIGHLLVDIRYAVQHIHGIVGNSLNGITDVLCKRQVPFLHDTTLWRSLSYNA